MEIKSSTKFCHYTSLESARSILNSECFFLGRYDTMNDLAEARQHRKDSGRVFVLSLCNSEALNIPLFYLYGGIDGKGCRIQFTDARIREIIRNCSLSYVNSQYKRLKKVIQPCEYDIYYDWIYYISSNGYCEHKKAEYSYQSLEEAKRILSADNRHYFIKNPIWKYENEFRIVVVFKEEIPYDHVALNFNIKDNEKGISVALGPETSEEECNALANEFKDYGITKCSRISDSAVSMGLVNRNNRLLR